MAKEGEKKKKIILAAIAEFARDGFEKASIDRIAFKAKVAKGTVFYHFKSKQELFEEVVDEGHRTFENIIEIETKQLESEKEKIGRVVEIEIDFIRQYRDLFSIYLADIIKKMTDFKKIEEILERGIKKEKFKKDLNIKNTATALFWMTAMTTLNSEKVDKEEMKELIFGGISK